MKMNREEIINLTEEFVKEKVAGFDGGHDWWHVMRVRNLALFINSQEPIADAFTLEIAALLHDIADSKFVEINTEHSFKEIYDFMTNNGMEEIMEQVLEVIRNVSFSNKNPSGNIKDPVLLILQDADRLDAIGAIGIARAFNYGGFRNNALYIPGDQDANEKQSTITHFFDKLLKLKDLMNTATGRKIAKERHAFLEKFLKQFNKEWKFDTLSHPRGGAKP
jgi:uncharacterized protein